MLNDRIDKLINTPRIINTNLTFSSLIDEWYLIYKQQVRESTYLSTWDLLNGVKNEIGNDTLVRNIDTVLINNVLENLIYGEKNLSNKYISIIKSKLNLIFKYSVKKGYIALNPIERVTIEYKKQGPPLKVKDKFLEDDEYIKLVQYTASHNERYSLLFQWLYLTGMRAGEAIALNKSDITIDTDQEIYIAKINGTMQYRGRTVHNQKKSKETKTQARMREVSLSKKAVNIIDSFTELNKYLNTDYLFTTSKGTPFQLNAINTYLRKLSKQLEIDKPLSSHIFRHTHISKLAEIGSPLYAIQDRVGHENSKITESIYLHVTKGVKEKLNRDIELL